MPSDYVYEATDCVCSSVACNCLQVSCCIPSPLSKKKKNLASSFADVDNSCWMDRLGSANPNIKFRDLVLVGAHDSASFSISGHKPYSAVARCQNMDTTQQLQAGVRILDVHVAPGKAASGIAVWHGCAQGRDLVDAVLTPLRDFVHRHPQEIIILQLVPELGRDFSVEQKKQTFHLVKQSLSSAILHGGHVSQLLKSWTLGDLRNRQGARVVVFVHNRFFAKIVDRTSFNESHVLDEFGFAPMEKWLRNLWFNTNNMDALMKYALDEVTRYGPQKRQFHVSQLVLRPGVGGFGDVMAAFVGVNKLRPASLAFRLYRRLGRYLRENANQGWNWVLFDFVDYGPWIVHFLTALNFPVSLKVHLAIYNAGNQFHGVNVTPHIQACVCRNRVLYVDSFEEVLGLDKPCGTLTIVFTLGKEVQVASLNIDETEHGQAVILSAYGHSCHAEECITSLPEGRDHGYLYNGSVLPGHTDASKLKGTVLEFTNVDDVFSCQMYIAQRKSRRIDVGADKQERAVQPIKTKSAQRQLLVLVSKQSFDRTAVQNQQDAVTILQSKGIDFTTLDGADPLNKDTRNDLFSLSNLRGKYPQFFIVENDGSKHFWGDMDTFNSANEAGSLSIEFGGRVESGTPPLSRDASLQQRSINTGASHPPPVGRALSADDSELLVLVSQQSFDRVAVQNQQNALTILDSQGIKYNTLDGADPSNKEVRNELFSLSGLRGKYPQFFLGRKNGNKTFWGDMEAFDAANDATMLSTVFGGRKQAAQKVAPSKPTEPQGRSITNIPSAPKIASASSQTKGGVLVLISKQSLDRSVAQNQQNAMTILDSKGIKYKALDGADLANKDARSELFDISKLRAKYPQFFLVNDDGTIEFWGDMETFSYANENNILAAELGWVTSSSMKLPSTHSNVNGKASSHKATPSSSPTSTITPNEILVLVSMQSFDRKVVQNQQQALHTLHAMKIPHKTIDGADPANREARNELFRLSGIRGEYPQFFVVQSNGETLFWGGISDFQAANENGTIARDLKKLSA